MPVKWGMSDFPPLFQPRTGCDDQFVSILNQTTAAPSKPGERCQSDASASQNFLVAAPLGTDRTESSTASAPTDNSHQTHSNPTDLLIPTNGKTSATWQVRSSGDQTQAGLPGRLLSNIRSPIRWYISAATVYMLGAIAAAVYTLTRPSLSPGNRVLPLWNVEVNQFYSGLALSLILTPGAVIIRQISHHFALLQPFAIASNQPVSLSDLDILMDPGLSATLRLFRYVRLTGLIQATLVVAGVTLVPVGTLTIYPGTYSAPESGAAVVGMPTFGTTGTMMNMRYEMGFSVTDYITFNMNRNDSIFMSLAMNAFLGDIISQTGVVATTDSRLAPLPTSNLTYEDSKRYSGIVTYTWDAGCSYTDQIVFNETIALGSWLFNVTFPTGDSYQDIDAFESWKSDIRISGKPDNGTTYFAIVGTTQETVNFDAAVAASAITIANGSWISRVACTPTFTWHTSSCTWDAASGSMRDCTDAPGSNTTMLDVDALDALATHISLVPRGIYATHEVIFGLPALSAAVMFDLTVGSWSESAYRAPLLEDYSNMYGLVARALASVSTSGYYGTAEVPTTGSAPRPAYIVREAILGVVLALLVLPSLLCGYALSAARVRGRPFRPATLLTVAAATRGRWWDGLLYGDCVRPYNGLLERHKGVRVKFGVDAEVEGEVGHVGFVPGAGPVMKNELYAGVQSSLSAKSM